MGFFCLLSDQKLDQNKNEIIFVIEEHPVSLTEILGTGQQELKEISWLAIKTDRTLHLPQKLKVIVKHGLNTTCSYYRLSE